MRTEADAAAVPGMLASGMMCSFSGHWPQTPEAAATADCFPPPPPDREALLSIYSRDHPKLPKGLKLSCWLLLQFASLQLLF